MSFYSEKISILFFFETLTILKSVFFFFSYFLSWFFILKPFLDYFNFAIPVHHLVLQDSPCFTFIILAFGKIYDLLSFLFSYYLRCLPNCWYFLVKQNATSYIKNYFDHLFCVLLSQLKSFIICLNGWKCQFMNLVW